MGASLGSLVVSLEANMAKFQSDMKQSADLTMEAMMKMVAGSDKAQLAIKHLETQASNAKAAAISLGKGLIIGAAAGMSLSAIEGKIMGVIESMGKLKIISEKTGASVENLSKLAFFGKQVNTDIDTIASALGKMSKGMAGADNETKGAGLALDFLGIKAKDSAGNLKDPAAMFTEIGKKLSEYQDGAGKAAIAQALFGKSGIELLPTLKLIGEAGETAAKVTTDQANAAHEYERNMVKLEAQQKMFFKTVATQLLPTMTDFSSVLIDAATQTNNLNGAAKDLAKENVMSEWADDAALGLAVLLDVIIFIPKALSAVGSSFKVVGAEAAAFYKASEIANPVAAAKLVLQGKNPNDELRKIMAERDAIVIAANKKYEDLWNYNGAAMMQGMEKRIAARKQIAETEGVGVPGSNGKALNYNTAGEDDAARKAELAAREAAKYAKLSMDQRLKVIENGLAEEQGAMAFADKYMAELRSQDLINLEMYNDYRKKAVDSMLAVTLAAYDKEIALAEKRRNSLAKGSEKESVQIKIDTIRAARDKAVQDAQQAGAMRTLELSAAQSQLNIATKEWIILQGQSASQFQFEISMYGKSATEVAKLTAARRIYLDVEERIRQAQKNSATPIDRSAFESARDAEIARSNALYDQADAKQKDPWFNASESLRKYGETADNVGVQIGDAMTHAFTNAEDALVQFVTTGKLSFKGLVTSVLADFARIEARKGLSALFSMAADSIGGSMMGGSWLGDFGGARATGGPVSGGTSYLVGEKGPEIFTAPGNGTIIPNHALGGGSGGGVQINLTTNVSDSGSSSQASGDGGNARALADALNQKMKAVIVQEMRQGGVIWNMQTGRMG